MRLSRLALLLVFALPLFIVPVSAHARVFVSVAIAPPIMPVYAQPLCPEPGWMWMPGYWAYDYDNGGYYWVPGTWVPAPYEGALWTPGYWGWETGAYLWHGGYWGRHIGYYGGVNYGFGYFGIGFIGGMWRGHDFLYNRAYMRIGEGYRNAYEDRSGFESHAIMRDSHVAYSGGPGGINHRPVPEERLAEREQHTQPTSFQSQHFEAARQDRSAYFNSNHGAPTTLAAQRPLTASRPATTPGNASRPSSSAQRNPYFKDNPNSGSMPTNSTARGNYQPANPGNVQQRNQTPQQTPSQSRGSYQPSPRQPSSPASDGGRGGNNPFYQGNNRQQTVTPSNPQPQYSRPQANNPAPVSRPQPQVQSRPQIESRPVPQSRPQVESRPAPQSRPQVESRPAPQSRGEQPRGGESRQGPRGR